jgi:dinuclear metal center YbgI/SA1388 family protein
MELINLLNRLGKAYPASLAEDWDFPGYQVGKKDLHHEIRKVFLCLDFSELCFNQALTFKPDLIITHHPFLFGTRRKVLAEDSLKDDLTVRIEAELSCPIYSYHTAYDKARNGMNDTILTNLGLTPYSSPEESLIRFAKLDKPMTMDELALFLKKKLGIDYVRTLTGMISPIETIGLVAGGGSSYARKAIDLGADAFLSGDCPQHTRLDLRRYQINYIELPHEIEEQGFLTGMGKKLLSLDSSLSLASFAYEKDFDLTR